MTQEQTADIVVASYTRATSAAHDAAGMDVDNDDHDYTVTRINLSSYVCAHFLK